MCPIKIPPQAFTQIHDNVPRCWNKTLCWNGESRKWEQKTCTINMGIFNFTQQLHGCRRIKHTQCHLYQSVKFILPTSRCWESHVKKTHPFLRLHFHSCPCDDVIDVRQMGMCHIIKHRRARHAEDRTICVQCVLLFYHSPVILFSLSLALAAGEYWFVHGQRGGEGDRRTATSWHLSQNSSFVCVCVSLDRKHYDNGNNFICSNRIISMLMTQCEAEWVDCRLFVKVRQSIKDLCL